MARRAAAVDLDDGYGLAFDLRPAHGEFQLATGLCDLFGDL
jgi:hypothetical protein